MWCNKEMWNKVLLLFLRIKAFWRLPIVMIVTKKDTPPVALLARAPTFRRSSAWRGISANTSEATLHAETKMVSLFKNRSQNMRSTYRIAICFPPPPESVLFHFLSSTCQTSFPFLQFSTAASLVSNFYSCIPNTFSEIGLADVMTIHWLLQGRHQISKVFWFKAHIWELKRWFLNLSPTTIQLFGFLHWMVSISFFCSQHEGHILKMYRVSNDATIYASVCILNPVCSLHFVSSLHFKPNLQSAVCILYWPIELINVLPKAASSKAERT